MEQLFVFFETDLVGTISYKHEDDKYDFKYEDAWKINGFELSPALKFSGFKDSAIKLFIENLLPEGNGLEDISQYFRISKSNKLGLLKAIGLDTAGALKFLSSREYHVDTTFREITKSELEQRVNVKNSQSITIWDKKPRLSVAGVQEKLPILIMDKKIGFGEGELCSTHILKFNKKGENVILNEYISLQLCKDVGLDVAEVEYKSIGNEKVLFVKRFDRELLSETKVARRHVIDGVQALGLPVSFKYERVYGSGEEVKDFRDGVSWKKLFALIDKAKVPILFKEKLIEWNIINLCLGNSDAHGKNISFFVNRDGLEITPFYDIVNITMYEDTYEQEMAMAIDDTFTYDLNVFDFKEFLQQNKIDIKYYYDAFGTMVSKLNLSLKKFDFVEEAILKDEQEFCNKYKENVLSRINRLIEILNRLRYPHQEAWESDQEFFEAYKDDIYKLLRIKKSEVVDVESTIDVYKKVVLERSIKKL